ncbi:MAG: hypothetical protein J2P31_01280 [Blastocatellia bacterium]|nr:hypothetical protein [Blastocatellia bacterium]
MAKKTIPDEVRKEVEAIVDRFNQIVMKKPVYYYIPRYKGRFLYLDRFDHGRMRQTCRLEYTGQINKWKFAIFKYSDMAYDPDEWMFPGSGHIDGTIEGAMRAGMDAYP